MKDNLIERVLKTIRSYDMTKPSDVILAAVSGGPDSVFMLRSLDNLKRKLGIKRIVVCHLDHGLRGKESREDLAFVKRLARELGLKFVSKRVAPGALLSKELSTEERGREERYKFLRAVLAKEKATVIATGHTLDDQAETILMRLIKGASLKGMAGIAPVRDEGACRIIRPIIELEKSEVKRYLDEANIPYRIDRTNEESIYFRNVVRREIIPFLERYNPRLKRVLSNLAGHLREDFEFIAKEKSRAMKGMRTSSHNGALGLELKTIVVQPRALQKEILRDLLERSGGSVKKLSFRHWKELENLIKLKKKGKSVDLPGGIRAERTSSEIVFRKIILP